MTLSFEEQLALVRELQEIDLALHNLQQALDALPAKLRELEATSAAAKAELGALRGEFIQVEKSKRDDEMELAVSVERLRLREAKLYAIKTNREYQAALKEVSEGKRTNREREDRILQAMERIESLSKKITQLEKESADKETACQAERAAVEKRDAEIRGEMAGDEVRRPDVAARLDKAIRRKYDLVRKRYAMVVAEVGGGICQGCSRRIPQQLFNEMLRRTDIKVCPNCQRLIFVVEKKAEEQPEGLGAAPGSEKP